MLQTIAGNISSPSPELDAAVKKTVALGIVSRRLGTAGFESAARIYAYCAFELADAIIEVIHHGRGPVSGAPMLSGICD